MSELEFLRGSKTITFDNRVDEDLELAIEIQGRDTLHNYEAFHINESQAKKIVEHLNHIFDFNTEK